MEPVDGVVAVVQLGAGQGDKITVFFTGDDSRHQAFDAVSGEVYCDGKRVTAAGFCAWFLEHDFPVEAKLYPDASKYMNATKAEFTSS